MIEKSRIEDIIGSYIQDTDIFLVDIKVNAGNIIQVFLDKPTGITLNECSEISNFVIPRLNKDIEDFELEISSPGLGMPFKVLKQYQKNINKEIDIVLNNSMKVKGLLKSASAEKIEIEETIKLKNVIQKKTEYNKVINTYLMKEIKSAKLIVNFK